MISPHGPIESKELSDAQRIKRMCSGLLDANSGGDVVAIGYITTPITVTSVQVYATETANGGGGGGNLVVDVGIDGDGDAIVAAEAIASISKDEMHECTIGTADVAADHMLTASINIADGVSGMIQVAIEYYENE